MSRVYDGIVKLGARGAWLRDRVKRKTVIVRASEQYVAKRRR